MTTELQVPLIRRALDPIFFVIYGPPVAKLTPAARAFQKFVPTKKRKVWTAMMYTHPDTRAAMESFTKAALPFAPAQPLGGAIRAEFLFVLPIPASWSPREKAAAATGVILPEGKPDLSNFIKLAEDSMNRVFWIDDSHVVEYGRSRKIYGTEPRTEVTITPLLPGESE